MTITEAHIFVWLFIGMVIGFQSGWLGAKSVSDKERLDSLIRGEKFMAELKRWGDR